MNPWDWIKLNQTDHYYNSMYKDGTTIYPSLCRQILPGYVGQPMDTQAELAGLRRPTVRSLSKLSDST